MSTILLVFFIFCMVVAWRDCSPVWAFIFFLAATVTAVYEMGA